MAQKQYPIINNFSKGELSSRMEGRVDIQGYYNGCKTMKNCIMVAQGGAEKRPGTIYMGETYKPTRKSRLIPFEVNDEEKFVIEFGDHYIRFWNVKTHELEEVTSGSTVMVGTPYSSDDISSIQYAQTEGQIYLTHVNYSVRFITRIVEKDDNGEIINSGFTLSEPEHTIQVYSSGTYHYGDVVYSNSLGDFYKALRTTVAAPAHGEWSVGSNVIDETITTNISKYPGGSFLSGDFVLWNGIIYKARRDFLTGTGGEADCIPEIGIYEETDWENYGGEKYEWVWSTDLRWHWTSGFIPLYVPESYKSYIKRHYENEKTKVTGFWSAPAGAVAGAIVSAFVPGGTILGAAIGQVCHFQLQKKGSISSENTQDPYWKSIISTGAGSTENVYKWNNTDTYNPTDIVYNPNDMRLYICTETSVGLEPSKIPDWLKVSRNPFFDLKGDYPSSVAFMEQRLYLGGTKNHPQTIYASRVGRPSDFNTGLNDDDGFSFTIAADRSSRIKWLMAKDHLMIGTSSSEWLATGNTAPISPTNIQVLRQSAYGSAYSQAVFVADSLLFFQKGGRKLREYIYSNDNKSYLANDLTFFADHITETGLIESIYQQNPDSILWSIKGNGTLIGLTYDRLNQIAGWHRHETYGIFESVCAVDSFTDEDEVWFIVLRKIGGVYKRFIERMAPRLEYNRSYLVFSDSAKIYSAGGKYQAESIIYGNPFSVVTYSGEKDLSNGDYIKFYETTSPLFDYQIFIISNINTVTKTFELLDRFGNNFTPEEYDSLTGQFGVVSFVVTGLDHLLGEEVSILGDNSVFPNQEVIANVDGLGGIGITLSTPCNTVICGLGYTMILEPESIELPGSNTLGSKKRISKIDLKLYNTLGGKAGNDVEKLEELRFRGTSLPFGLTPPLFTGIKTVGVDAPSDSVARIMVVHDQPLPMTVLAIISDITYSRS